VGILDKARNQMDQVKSVVQDQLAQGQGKLDQLQAQRQLNDLYRTLGQAYYAKEKQGGAAADVTDILAKIDAFLTQNPPATKVDENQAPETEEGSGDTTS